MKKVFRKTSLLLATALMGVTGMQAQKAPQDMDRFIDALMKKMTVEEKIGQLNLPVSGEIVTGQAQNSDVAKKIEQGWVGGLLNLKGVEKIRRCTETCHREITPGYPPDIRYGCGAWLRNNLPYSIGALLLMGYGRYQKVRPHCCYRSQCRWHLMDIQPDGRYQP